MWNFIRRKPRRCCECDTDKAKLFKWSDHNDTGWVCMKCAWQWDYVDYLKL